MTSFFKSILNHGLHSSFLFLFFCVHPDELGSLGVTPGATGHVSRPLSPPQPSHFHQWNRPAANTVFLFNCLCGCKTGQISKTELSVLGTSPVSVLSCWILSGRPHAFLTEDPQAFLIEEVLHLFPSPVQRFLWHLLHLDFLVSVHLRFSRIASTLNILWRIHSQDTSWAQRSHTSYGDHRMGAPFSPVSLEWSRVCCPWTPGLGPHLCLWKNWQDVAVSAGSKGSLLAEGIPPVTAPLGAKRMAKSLSSQFPLVIFQRLSQKEVLLPDFFPFFPLPTLRTLFVTGPCFWAPGSYPWFHPKTGWWAPTFRWEPFQNKPASSLC